MTKQNAVLKSQVFTVIFARRFSPEFFDTYPVGWQDLTQRITLIIFYFFFYVTETRDKREYFHSTYCIIWRICPLYYFFFFICTRNSISVLPHSVNLVTKKLKIFIVKILCRRIYLFFEFMPYMWLKIKKKKNAVRLKALVILFARLNIYRNL